METIKGFIYGELNKNIQKVEYKGTTTETSKVNIDNDNRIISVDVLKVPYFFTINYKDIDYIYDGSKSIYLKIEKPNYSDVILPETGIPRKDLDESTKSSLDKADSAIQRIVLNTDIPYLGYITETIYNDNPNLYDYLNTDNINILYYNKELNNDSLPKYRYKLVPYNINKPNNSDYKIINKITINNSIYTLCYNSINPTFSASIFKLNKDNNIMVALGLTNGFIPVLFDYNSSVNNNSIYVLGFNNNTYKVFSLDITSNNVVEVADYSISKNIEPTSIISFLIYNDGFGFICFDSDTNKNILCYGTNFTNTKDILILNSDEYVVKNIRQITNNVSYIDSNVVLKNNDNQIVTGVVVLNKNDLSLSNDTSFIKINYTTPETTTIELLPNSIYNRQYIYYNNFTITNDCILFTRQPTPILKNDSLQMYDDRTINKFYYYDLNDNVTKYIDVFISIDTPIVIFEADFNKQNNNLTKAIVYNSGNFYNTELTTDNINVYKQQLINTDNIYFDYNSKQEINNIVINGTPLKTIKKASDVELGGIKAAAKINDDNEQVRIDDEGKLWVNVIDFDVLD